MSVIILNAQNFEKEVLQSEQAVMVDFYADWCGPCQMAGPVIDQLAEEYAGKIKVGKLNVDENSDIAGQYGVMSIPAVIVFVNGQEKGRQVGFGGKEGYVELIKKALGEKG